MYTMYRIVNAYGEPVYECADHAQAEWVARRGGGWVEPVNYPHALDLN